MKIFRTKDNETLAAFVDDEKSDAGVDIMNTGLIHCALPVEMTWVELKEWATVMLKIAETAEQRGYPQIKDQT